MNTHPICPYCSRPLQKYCEYEMAPRASDKTMAPIAGWTYRGTQVPVRYKHVWIYPEHNTFCLDKDTTGAEKRIDGVFIWDGESYKRVGKFFCSTPCALEFAQEAHISGWKRERT